MAAEACVVEIAGLLCRIEGLAQQRAASPGMPRPASESEVDAGLEAIQAAPVDEVEPELAEAIPRLVVAEVRPQHGAEHNVGKARRVAVAVFEAEICDPRDDQAAEVIVDVP